MDLLTHRTIAMCSFSGFVWICGLLGTGLPFGLGIWTGFMEMFQATSWKNRTCAVRSAPRLYLARRMKRAARVVCSPLRLARRVDLPSLRWQVNQVNPHHFWWFKAPIKIYGDLADGLLSFIIVLTTLYLNLRWAIGVCWSQIGVEMVYHNVILLIIASS